MKSDTLLEGTVQTLFCRSASIARRSAMKDAANSGGLLLSVRSLELSDSRLTLIGELPTAPLDSSPRRRAGRLKVTAGGLEPTFYTTWADLMDHGQEVLGYLVLRHPVRVVGGEVPESALAMVAVDVSRRGRTLSPRVIGQRLCVHCNEPIPAARLSAQPKARTCVNCQAIEESRQ